MLDPRMVEDVIDDVLGIEPRELVTDKCVATIATVNKPRNKGFLKSVDYRLSKYLNNGIEQDHRQIKNTFQNT